MQWTRCVATGLPVGLLLAVPADSWAGAQKRFDVAEAGDQWSFDIRWVDHTGKPVDVHFDVPVDAVDADRDERTWFPRREFNEDVAKAVRAYGRTVKRVEVTAKVANGGVVIGASGPKDQAKAVMAKAEAVRDEAVETWLVDHDFFRMDSGDLSYDHARLVDDYTDAVRPVALALQEGTAGERDYVERVLSFVQAIPYEAQKRNGGDPGYRRPLALLYRNRGDCDSKAVLFLSLVEAVYPDLDTSVVYVPGHALTGVGLPEGPGDMTFEAGGKTYLYAEPVGPAPHPLGQPAPENKKAAKKGEVHPVPG